MERFDFSSSSAHVAEHHKFIEEVAAFRHNYQQGSLSVSVDILTFLRDWLSNHILQSDRVMVKEVLGKGVEAA